MSALREIARALSAAWDLDTTLDLIVHRTTTLMAVDSCSIYLLDPGGALLRLRATTGLARRALGRATLTMGEGMTGYAVAHNRPVFAADARSDPLFKPVAEADEGSFTSLLAIPLVIDQQPIGALNVQTLELRRFDEDELALLLLVGDLAAGALAKARLYDRQKQQIDELRALAMTSEAVTSPQYLDDILDIVTALAAETMQAAVCSIFLVNENGTHLDLRSAERKTRPYRHRPPLPVDQGLIGRVFQSGQSLTVTDVRTHDGYLSADLARDEGLVSLLAVPLSVRERVIGVLACYTDQQRTFSPEQQAWFLTLANQTALGIENTRLVTNAAVVREMHHRIKNNLQTIAMLMQLQLADAAQLTARQVLHDNIHRVHAIAAVHEVLSERGFHLVDVRDVVTRIAQMTALSMTLPDVDLDIQVFGEALFLPSRVTTLLALAINELVQNALEHGFRGRTSGTVRISIGLTPEEVAILVSDNGRGLPEPLQRGLGLELVENLIQGDLNGRIRFHRLHTGTEVSLRVPRAIAEKT